MSDKYVDFTFDSGDQIVGRKIRSFKAKEKETYRVSFPFLTDDGLPRFVGCERHYLQGVGYFLHLGPEYSKLAGGPPKQAIATVVLLWPTDSQGHLNAESFKRGEGHQILPWVFSADKYEVIKRRHSSFPLSDYDLQITCTDTQYQKLDISPEKDSLLKRMLNHENERVRERASGYLEEAAKIGADLRSVLARELTVAQIREKLGQSTGGPPTSVTGEDVDNLVDNLLDDE